MKVAGAIEKTPGDGGWCFVRLPGDIREELEAQSGKKRASTSDGQNWQNAI